MPVPAATMSSSRSKVDALRREIADLTSLLAVMEHYRHEKIDVTSYKATVPFKADRPGFLNSVAHTLSTADRAVAVAGALRTCDHLELVVAIEEENVQFHERTLPRSDSEVTLVATPETKENQKEYFAPKSDPTSKFIQSHFAPSRMAQRDARYIFLKERATEVRQKITASDLLFPYHTSGFREIFSGWTGTDSVLDYTLLPKGGVSTTIHSVMGIFISKIVVGVWNKDTGKISFTNANLPRWVNGLGLLLGYIYLAFGNPKSEPEDLCFLIEVLYVFKEFFASDALKRVFTRSSLALALKTCYETAHPIGPHNHAAHEYYPLPTCIQQLVESYLSRIIDVVLHAKNVERHHRKLTLSVPPAINVKEITVDIVNLNLKDPLSYPVSSLEDVLLAHVSDLEWDENWFVVRRERLQARISANIHPEAAVMCMKRAHIRPNEQCSHHHDATLDSHSLDVISRIAPTRYVGMSRKMCYCCAVVDAWTKKESGVRVEHMDPQRTHGRILPWLPPPYGLSIERLESLREDLVATLDILVAKLRWDDTLIQREDLDFRAL